MKRQRSSSSVGNDSSKYKKGGDKKYSSFNKPEARYIHDRSSLKTSESKAVDTIAGNADGVTMSTGAMSIQTANLIQAGSGFYNRIGRLVKLKSLHLHGYFARTAGAVDGTPLVRVMVIYDGQPNGALPVISTLLQNVDQIGNAGTTEFALADLNLDWRQRFKVLADWRVVLPGGPATTYESFALDSSQHKGVLNIERFIKLKGLTTQFKADNNPCSIADIASGALYIMTIGTDTGAGWSFRASWRLRFDD